MKTSVHSFVGFLFLTIILSSCGPTYSPFTQRLYEDYRWEEEELQQIQFYLSEDIVLRREYAGGSSEIIAGEITVVEGRDMEEVVIRRGTPGVFLFSPKQNRFAISFDEEGDYLMFGPNPKLGNRYALLASHWRRNEGVITYGGRKYRVDSRSAYATLMVDLKRVQRNSSHSKVASGRRINPF